MAGQRAAVAKAETSSSEQESCPLEPAGGLIDCLSAAHSNAGSEHVIVQRRVPNRFQDPVRKCGHAPILPPVADRVRWTYPDTAL